MYYSYIETEYVATSFSPARTDLAVKLLSKRSFLTQSTERETKHGGTKGYKKLVIGRRMGGDGQECIDTPAARGLEELFSAVLERFLEPIHNLRVYCKN